MSENKKDKLSNDAENINEAVNADTDISEAIAAEQEVEEVKTYSPTEKKAEPVSDKTMLFKKVEEKTETADEARDMEHTIIVPAAASGDTLSNTRHFSLRGKGKRAPAEKGRKNLMHNFRVLSKNREDRAILEANYEGDGGRNFADSVKARQGEDIFEAVEKAYIDSTEEKKKQKQEKSLFAKRNEKGAAMGEELHKELEADISKHEKAMLVFGVLFALSLILTLFFSNTVFYGVASLVISLAACGLCLPAFRNCITAIRDFNAVADTAVAVMSFFVLIHNICSLALGQTGSVYTLCVIFACFTRIGANYFRLRNKDRLVSMTLRSKSLSILQRIPLKKDAVSFTKKVGKNEEPDIFYCTKAMLDTSLEEPETDSSKENKYYIFTMSLVLIASLVVGLFCFTVRMTGLSFITALTATVCALLPVMYDPISRFIFFRNGNGMLNNGACISGREALAHIGKSDGFVLDASDVFSGEVSRFRKSATSRMDQNDSAVFAALLIKEAGSVLAPCFDSFLEQMNIVVPPVENFLYEERLGYSAWVLDRKVLVGNRQMLLNHSISVPTAEQEKAYAKGRYVMYVVIDGEITATFLVGYKVLSSLRKYSRDFNKTGLVIMLNSREAFLDEQAVAARLSIDASSVKVLSSKATAIMEKYNSRYEKQRPTGLLCSGKKRSIMHLIMGCYNANASDRLILGMMLAGQAAGFIVLLLSAVLDMKLFFNPVAIISLRIIWSLITGFIIQRKNY